MDVGDYIADLSRNVDRAESLLSPDVIAKVSAAREALTAERARLVHVAAQIEDQDAEFREAIQTMVDLIESAIEALIFATPDRPVRTR